MYLTLLHSLSLSLSLRFSLLCVCVSLKKVNESYVTVFVQRRRDQDMCEKREYDGETVCGRTLLWEIERHST